MYGPNGFFRGLKGNTAKLPEGLSCQLVYKKDMVQLVFHNTGKPVKVRVKDAYGQSDSKSHTLKTRYHLTIDHLTVRSHGWYDLRVVCNDGDLEYHFAGHVETGAESFSDPIMGGIM